MTIYPMYNEGKRLNENPPSITTIFTAFFHRLLGKIIKGHHLRRFIACLREIAYANIFLDNQIISMNMYDM